MESRKELGNCSEKLAFAYLKKQGYTLIQQNFSCRSGEIDLIVKKDQLLVFVEVRSRSMRTYGEPFETVTSKKQEKLRKAAGYYLYLHPMMKNYYCRFDVISVVWQNGNAEITWIPDAFS